MQLIEPFVVKCLQQQLAFGLHTNVCFCIGEGENLKYLQKMNARFGWFEKIVSLPHPRFIMQYRLKSKEAFIQLYVEKLNAAHLSIKKETGAA